MAHTCTHIYYIYIHTKNLHVSLVVLPKPQVCRGYKRLYLYCWIVVFLIAVFLLSVVGEFHDFLFFLTLGMSDVHSVGKNVLM